MAKTASRTGKGKSITLRHVILHMQDMKQDLLGHVDRVRRDLSSDIQRLSVDMRRMSDRIDANTRAIQHLTIRVAALDEEIVAVMHDTLAIRKFAGMPVPEEEAD